MPRHDTPARQKVSISKRTRREVGIGDAGDNIKALAAGSRGYVTRPGLKRAYRAEFPESTYGPVDWALRHRFTNGLAKSGAVTERNGRLFIHLERFWAWFFSEEAAA